MAVSVTYKLDTASVGRVIIACQFCRLRANSFSHTVPSSMLYICCTQIYQDRSDLQLEMRSIQSPWRHPMSRSKASVFPFVIRSQRILLFRFVCPVVTLRPNSSASSFQTCALRSDILSIYLFLAKSVSFTHQVSAGSFAIPTATAYSATWIG